MTGYNYGSSLFALMAGRIWCLARVEDGVMRWEETLNKWKDFWGKELVNPSQWWITHTGGLVNSHEGERLGRADDVLARLEEMKWMINCPVGKKQDSLGRTYVLIPFKEDNSAPGNAAHT
jgi:hypothetical protein